MQEALEVTALVKRAPNKVSVGVYRPSEMRIWYAKGGSVGAEQLDAIQPVFRTQINFHLVLILHRIVKQHVFVSGKETVRKGAKEQEVILAN